MKAMCPLGYHYKAIAIVGTFLHCFHDYVCIYIYIYIYIYTCIYIYTHFSKRQRLYDFDTILLLGA